MIEPRAAQPPTTAELREGETLDFGPWPAKSAAATAPSSRTSTSRYGDAGFAWCIHDNQHIVHWAVMEANGHGGFERQLAWLAGVLEARDFPLERLARNLEIAAAVVRSSDACRLKPSVVLEEGARFVRSRYRP